MGRAFFELLSNNKQHRFPTVFVLVLRRILLEELLRVLQNYSIIYCYFAYYVIADYVDSSWYKLQASAALVTAW